MKTKGELVEAALRKAGIASNATLTNIEPESMQDALNDLELMMLDLDANGIRLGYALSDDPMPDDEHRLPDWAVSPVMYNLAVYILPDYLREATPTIAARAAHGMQTLIKAFANKSTPSFQYKNGFPMGSGNVLYRRVGVRYFHIAPKIEVENDGNLANLNSGRINEYK